MKSVVRVSALLSFLFCAVVLAGGRAVFAQDLRADSHPFPAVKLLTSYDNGAPTDNLSGVVLDFGILFVVTYAQNLDIYVNVPDGHGGKITGGTVSLRVNDKSYPVSYAGPAPGFTGFQQINIPIPRDDFPNGATVYLRTCDSAGNCRNSTGATVRR